MLVSFALSALLHACAPTVGARTLAAVIAFESGGHAEAIGDNTSRRAYFPSSAAEARELAMRLIRAHHDLDLGLMQINVRNLQTLNLTVDGAFDPCSNVSAGSRLLSVHYLRASRRFGQGQRALFWALSAYNTGSYWAGAAYARNVYDAAARLHFESRR